MAESRDSSLKSLKAVLPQVRDSIAKTQSRYKRDYKKNARPLRVSVASGDWSYLRNNPQKHKLDPKVT